jgi:Cytochrome c
MPPMPAFESQLTEEEIDDVVAYLDTLPVGPRNFGTEGDDEMMDGMMDGGMWSWLLWSVLFLVFVAAIAVGRSPTTRSVRGTTPPNWG